MTSRIETWYNQISNSTKITAAFITITFIFATIAAGYAIGYTQNKQRIHDIQASRIYSCRKTYSGIREAFEPFFPKGPLTEQQKQDIDTFDKTIDHLVASCDAQVDPGENSTTTKG